MAARCLDEMVPRAIQLASELGVAGLLFDARHQLRPEALSETGRRQLLHRLEKAGLSVAGLTFPLRHRLYDLELLDQRIAALKNVLAFSFQLRAPLVTLPLGGVPDSASDDFGLAVEVLNDLAAHANRVGALIALNVSHEPPAAVRNLLGRVSAGPVAINFQPDQIILAGRDPEEQFRALYRDVQHVVVRDVVRDGTAGGEETPLGRGEVDWETLLQLLDEASYRGWLTLERRSGPDVVGDLSNAVAYLRRLERGD
ncbi:MAG: sugar phosphate isomerase/epimerase [Planctomycetota bacterium]|nr:MAG: sugar phosphate isomerase/epimerase [Planctomycetota bacterium]